MLNQQMGMPGVMAAAYTTTREIFWGGDASRQKILRAQGNFSSAARDATNDITTNLRPGLLLGQLTADSKIVEWNPAATNGSQFLRGVNEHELVMTQGYAGAATDRFSPFVVQAPVKASQLLILGVALTASPHQYLARRRLHEMGFVLDDDTPGYLAGVTRRTITKTATGAILANENGADIHVVGAGAVTLTLPTLATGLSYRFINGANQNLTIASAVAGELVTINDLAANSVTFSTANQLIGATLDVWSDYVNGTLKWLTQVQIGQATIAT